MREEILPEVKDTKEQVFHVQKDIHELNKRVKGVEVRQTNLEAKIDKGFSNLKNDIDTAIEVFNRDDTKLAKRVQAIEDHLNLPSQ